MNNSQHIYGGSYSTNSAALSAAADNIALRTQAALTAVVDGQFVTKAATAAIPFSVNVNAPGYNVPKNGSFVGAAGGSSRIYGVFLRGDASFAFLPGPIAVRGVASAVQWPDKMTSAAALGAVRIDLTAGTAYTPGVTATNAPGVTATYFNLADIPATLLPL